MIHIIIGTKAQFIKMVPVMKGLESRGIPYNFINLGQHAATVKSLAEQFQILGFKSQVGDDKNIISLPGMLKWLLGLLIIIILRKKHLNKNIFKEQPGVALIHGDTLSTLIGLLMAKRVGVMVAHVESGLRSWNYFNPFPEELIRVFCMKHSDYLFAPTDEAMENLGKMGVKGKVFHTHGNTGVDAVRSVVNNSHQSPGTDHQPYILVSIHRFENLYSRKRFKFILDTINDVSKKFNVIFVMHGPTERKLRKSGVMSQESGGVTYLPLQDYTTFLHLLKDAEFVITDGGSVQEECYYLGKPCLIMRKRTERQDGIGENAVLSEFDKGVTTRFLNEYNRNLSQRRIDIKPSELLINEILNLLPTS